MKHSDPNLYCYTMGAARARLARGYVDAYVFLPNDGRVARVTKRNVKQVAKRFAQAAQSGQA